MIVRWGLEELARLLAELSGGRSSSRARAGAALLRRAPTGGRRCRRIGSRCPETASTTIVAVGGGSAIDTGKAASAATGLPLVSVPTTYSGAEWTPFFGVRDPDRRMRGGGARRAACTAIVYEPELTLEPAARRDGRHGAERARALRRGALRRGAQRRRRTGMRSKARG